MEYTISPTIDLSSTSVTFPTGSIHERATVLWAASAPSLGVTYFVTDVTPFHPVDHLWKDQPGDMGIATFAGKEFLISDSLTGAFERATQTLSIDNTIKAKRSTPGIDYVVIHVLESVEVPEVHNGKQVTLDVDSSRRTSLSASHTASHLLALALNEVYAKYWNSRSVDRDSFKNPDFDSIAMQASQISEAYSTDVYRIGSSLRKAGFDADRALAALNEDRALVSARLHQLIGEANSARIETAGSTLGSRRSWKCEFERGTASIACGGTHLLDIGQLSTVVVEASISENRKQLSFTCTPALNN